MKSTALALMTLAFASCVCSCSKEPDQAGIAPASQPAQKTVLDTQLKALQKAKDVQKTVDQQKADMDKKLQEEGG